MGETSLRILVVFYSLQGSTQYAAQAIAAKTGADLLQLKPLRDVPARGFMKYFRGGKQAVKKEKPELEPFDKVANQYDLVFFGTPVWAGTFAPALNTFFSSQSIKGRKVALFCCFEGGSGKTFDHLRTELAGNAVLGELELARPARRKPPELQQEVETWAAQIVAQAKGMD